jgi:hypothetical protein
MESFNLSPILVEAFIRALILADSAGESEIGISHLLTSLDLMAAEKQPATPPPPGHPIPARDLPLSNEVRAVVDSIGGLEHATPEVLRSALRATLGRVT